MFWKHFELARIFFHLRFTWWWIILRRDTFACFAICCERILFTHIVVQSKMKINKIMMPVNFVEIPLVRWENLFFLYEFEWKPPDLSAIWKHEKAILLASRICKKIRSAWSRQMQSQPEIHFKPWRQTRLQFLIFMTLNLSKNKRIF